MESKISRSISLLPKRSKPTHPPVKIETSYFIPVSKHRIIEKLVQDLEANGASVDEVTSFKEFASIVEALLHLDAQKTLETMKSDYAVFAPPAKRALEGSAASYATEAGTRVVAVDEKKGSAQSGGSGYARRSSWMAVNSPKDVQTRMAHHRTHEERFFSGFVELMKKGNFSPISREQAETASKVQYMFTMPIDVNWKYICSVTMQRQRALLVDPIAFPHIRSEADLPDFANYFLVFYRGVSVDRRAGLFLLPKVNLIVEHLRNALLKLVRPLLGLQESSGTVNPAPTPVAASSVPGSLPVSESQTSLDSAAIKTEADEPQYIERRNLVDSWNQANDVLKWLTSEVYVQEPTYERLVLVYRESADLQKEGESLVVSTSAPPPVSATPAVLGAKAVPTAEDAKDQAVAANTDLISALEKEKHENLTGHVHIKFFKDVPMADLEVTYPEKSVKMAPAESFKLYISLALGLVFLIQGLFSEETESASYMVFVTSLLGYAVTSYFQFVAAMNMYHALLNDTLFQKSLDNDIGVLLVLTDAMEEQEFNETILAYYFLWRRGKMTPAQLKSHCEQFLRNKFSVKSSFEVYDALQKLEQRKLAKSDIPLDNVGSEPAEIVFENYPVDKAIEKLQKQWAQYEFRGF